MTAEKNSWPTDRDEQAALWCLTLADSELARHDRDMFDRWIADPENERAFEEAAAVWNMVDGAAGTPELIHMRSAALKDFTWTNRQRWTRRLPAKWHWITAVAATFLIAILSATFLYDPAQIYQTGIGERRIAMLDDGSKLSLDADTEVDVRLRKGRRDLTLLRGRAKFDVAHDPLRPFAVTAGDKIVVATGTSFSVEVLNRTVHVALYEGHVAVLDKLNDQPVRQRGGVRVRTIAADRSLTPGKELVAMIGASTSATIDAVDGPRSLSWESGQLSFDDEPLTSAIERMNRYSKEKLAIGDAGLSNVRVNGVFTAGDTDAFVEGVTALSPLRVTREPGKITLKSN